MNLTPRIHIIEIIETASGTVAAHEPAMDGTVRATICRLQIRCDCLNWGGEERWRLVGWTESVFDLFEEPN